MDAADAKALVEPLSDAVRPLTFIVERSAAMAVHVYGGALIVAAVWRRRPRWLAIGIASLLGLRRLGRDLAAASLAASVQG